MTEQPAKRPYSFQGLRTAALSAVAVTAIAFGGIALAQDPTPSPGGGGGEQSPTASPSPGSGGAQDYGQLDEQVRCTLITGELQKHVFIAGEAVQSIFTQDQARLTAAGEAATLHTQKLGDLIAAQWEEADAGEFQQLWGEHLNYYVEYANAQAGPAGGSGGQGTPGGTTTPSGSPTTPSGTTTPSGGTGSGEAGEAARQSLLEWATVASAWFSQANPDLDQAVLEEHLGMHVDNTLEYIDAEASNDPEALAMAGQEADHMTAFGAWLCGADESIFDTVEGGPAATTTPSGSGDGTATPSASPTASE